MADETQTNGGINFQAGRDVEVEVGGDMVAGDKILAETYIQQIIVQAADVKELEEQPPEAGESPFKGLKYFTEADAPLFFGRSALAATLVGRLHETRFLAVVGASGSGKSSVVRAGIVPAIKRGERLADGSLPPAGNWEVQVLTPTERPLTALAVALSGGADSLKTAGEIVNQLEANQDVLPLVIQRRLQKSGKDRLLLVVDQFEELFTLCRHEKERELVIEALVKAAHNDQKQLTVIIVVRADFYSQCLDFAALRTRMRASQEPIGMMSRAELLEAILRPTALHNWRMQEGLAELMLDEVGREPGGLPLLAHALLETWQRRRGRTLTLSGYREAGGVRGAIAQTAETAYQRFVEDEKQIARTIFLRLTELGLRVQETRRRVSYESLQVEGAEPEQIQQVLQTLVDVRLISVDDNEVEVAHEALIREWPTLREWLEEDREGLLIQQRLTNAADEWERHERERGFLYRGAPLAQLEAWVSQRQPQLNAKERAFWQASVAEQAQRAAEQEEQRRTAEKLETQQRIGRILRWATGIVAVFFVVAVIAAVVATNARGQAEDNFELASTREAEANVERARAQSAEGVAVMAQQTSEANAEIAREQEGIALAEQAAAVAARATSDANALLAATSEAAAVEARDDLADERLFALAQSLAAQAPRVVNADQGTDLALLLAVQAYHFNERVGPGAEFLIDNALRQLLNQPASQMVFQGHDSRITDALLSADGRYAVTLDDTGVTIVWPLVDSSVSPVQLGSELNTIALSPDGTYLYGSLFLAGIGRWRLDALDSEPDIFWPQNERLRFDASTENLLALENIPLRMVTAPNSGDLIVSTYGDGRLYNGGDLAADSQILSALNGISGQALAVSPDERFLAVGGLGGGVYLLDLMAADPELQTLAEGNIGVNGVAFTPNGEQLFSAGIDFQITRWSLTDDPPTSTVFYEHPTAFYSLAISQDGRWLAAGDDFGLILLWDLDNPELPPRELEGHGDEVTALQFDGTAERLLSASRDQTVRLWALEETGSEARPWLYNSAVTELAIAADGSIWAYSDSAMQIGVHYLDDGAAEVREFTGHEERVRSVAIAPDNQTIASIDDAGYLRFWSATEELSEPVFYIFEGSSPAPDLAWHPEKMMLVAGYGGLLYLWPSLETKQPVIIEMVVSNPNDLSMIAAVQFHPAGELLAVGYLSGEIHLWQVDQLLKPGGEPAVVIPGDGDKFLFGDLVFSPDGQRLAAGFDDNLVWVWSLADLEAGPITFEGHVNTIYSVAFDPSGRYLASAGIDSTILIWQVDDVTIPPIELRRDSRFVGTVVFTPDGRNLISVEDGLVYEWPLLPQLAAAACEAAGRNLTPQEWSRYMGPLPYEESCPMTEQVSQEIVVLEASEKILDFQFELLFGEMDEFARSLEVSAVAVRSGETEEALTLIEDLPLFYPDREIPASFWNELCWFGSLNGDAVLVLEACEAAVAAASPEEVPFYRDSRGLARALTGDMAGAIEDFTAFVEALTGDSNAVDFVETRQGWIVALEAGENPFTAAVLRGLRTEGQ